MATRIDYMKQFAFSPDSCRVNIMLEYFGEKTTAPCGKCDYCRQNKPSTISEEKLNTLRDSIIYMASQPGGHKMSHFVTTANARQEETIEMIRVLLDEGVLELVNDGETIKTSDSYSKK